MLSNKISVLLLAIFALGITSVQAAPVGLTRRQDVNNDPGIGLKFDIDGLGEYEGSEEDY